MVCARTGGTTLESCGLGSRVEENLADGAHSGDNSGANHLVLGKSRNYNPETQH